MQGWATPLDLGVIAGVGLGGWGWGFITFEKEKARNRSGPAHILIIRVVKVFSCNNAHPLSLLLAVIRWLHTLCACALVAACYNTGTYILLLINEEHYTLMHLHKSNRTENQLLKA